MTPYELSRQIHRDISAVAPKLSAALNRALNEIGEGSVLVGLGAGTNINDEVSFQETESINTAGDDPAHILATLTAIAWQLEENSPWKLIIDRKPGAGRARLDLLYTIFRSRNQ